MGMELPVDPLRIVKKRQVASKIGRLKVTSKLHNSKSIRYIANTDALFFEPDHEMSDFFSPPPIQESECCVEIKILVTSPTSGSFCHSISSEEWNSSTSTLPVVEPLDLSSAKKIQAHASEHDARSRDNGESEKESFRPRSRCSVYRTSSDTSETSDSDSSSSYSQSSPPRPETLTQVKLNNIRRSLLNGSPSKDTIRETKGNQSLRSNHPSAPAHGPAPSPSPVLVPSYSPRTHGVQRKPVPSANILTHDGKPRSTPVARIKPPFKTGPVASYLKPQLRSPKAHARPTKKKKPKLPHILTKLLPAPSASSKTSELLPSSSAGVNSLAKSLSMSSMTSVKSLTSNIKEAVVSGLAKAKTGILTRNVRQEKRKVQTKKPPVGNMGARQIKMWIEEDARMKRQKEKGINTPSSESTPSSIPTTPALSSSESFVTDSSLSEDDYVLLWHERRTNQAFTADDLNLTLSEGDTEDGAQSLPSSDSGSSTSSIPITELLRRCDSDQKSGNDSVISEKVPAWACFSEERGLRFSFGLPLSHPASSNLAGMVESKSSTISELLIRAVMGMKWELVTEQEPIFAY